MICAKLAKATVVIFKHWLAQGKRDGRIGKNTYVHMHVHMCVQAGTYVHARTHIHTGCSSHLSLHLKKRMLLRPVPLLPLL